MISMKTNCDKESLSKEMAFFFSKRICLSFEHSHERIQPLLLFTHSRILSKSFYGKMRQEKTKKINPTLLCLPIRLLYLSTRGWFRLNIRLQKQERETRKYR